MFVFGSNLNSGLNSNIIIIIKFTLYTRIRARVINSLNSVFISKYIIQNFPINKETTVEVGVD